MKRYLSFIVLTSLMLSLVGCGNNTPADSQPQSDNPDTIIEEAPFDPSRLDYPEVVAVHKAFGAAIKENDIPFIQSDIWSGQTDNTVEFSFSLEYDDAIPSAPITVSVFAYDGDIQNGFQVYLDQNCEDFILKDAIICSLIAVNPNLDYEQAEEKMHDMVEGFITGRSQILDMNEHRVHISYQHLLKCRVCSPQLLPSDTRCYIPPYGYSTIERTYSPPLSTGPNLDGTLQPRCGLERKDKCLHEIWHLSSLFELLRKNTVTLKQFSVTVSSSYVRV